MPPPAGGFFCARGIGIMGPMAKLILQRHLLSKWNKENKFTGWQDVPLSEEGLAQAPMVASKLPVKPDEVYTSPLVRNKETARLIAENISVRPVFLSSEDSTEVGENELSIYLTKALDERCYGKLEGKNKDEVKKEFGEEQVHLWRRSWDVAPPGGESLENVYNRALAFFQNKIEPKLRQDKNILIVGSHNSLRALAKYLEKIPDDVIADYEIPFGGMIVYDLDDNLSVVKKEVK